MSGSSMLPLWRKITTSTISPKFAGDWMTLPTGLANPDATAYSIGRDADATNQLHFNVPTGATFEHSINDVAVSVWGANSFTFEDSTSVSGLQIIPSVTSVTLNTIATAADASVILQNQTMTPGAEHEAVILSPSWATENFYHTGMLITATQNGANTNTLSGLRVGIVKATGATTLGAASAIRIDAPTVTGTITSSYGIDIVDQTNVNITTARAMRVVGTGAANAIQLGSSPLIYSSAAETILLMDSTDGGGISFTMTAAGDQQISTTDTGLNSIEFQQQTFTSGADHNAVAVIPTWATENFFHTAFAVSPTQNGANTNTLNGINITMTKATGATTLAAMVGLRISAPAVTGTVTSGYAIDIVDQTNVNITTARAMRIVGTGVSNAISFGSSVDLYANAEASLTLLQPVATSGSPTAFTVTGGAHTTLANADLVDISFNGARNVQFTGAGGGTTVTNARLFLLSAPTYTTAGAGALTVTNAGTLHITLPSAGAGGGGTTLTNSRGLYILSGPAATSTVTNIYGIDIGDIAANNAGQTVSSAINIQSQTQPVGSTFGITFVGAGTANSIRWANSSLMFSNGANQLSLTDASSTNGLTFLYSSGAAQTINTVTNTTGSIILQNQTFTPGATHDAVSITPTWATENFQHAALNITGTQNGANSNTLVGMTLNMVKATGATTLASMFGISIEDVTVAGTVTNSYGLIFGNMSSGGGTNSSAIVITSQSAFATTTRAIMIDGTSVNNAIRFGGATGPNVYSSGAETLVLMDSTNGGGLSFQVSAAADQQILTTDTGANAIEFQQQTFTAGATHAAVGIYPSWATENFQHTALEVFGTQNGANTIELRGLTIGLTKATGATTLASSVNLLINTPTVTGTITNEYGLYVANQGTANVTNAYGIFIATQSAAVTTQRAIEIQGTTVTNAIRFGASANLYAPAAETLAMMDSTNARGISYTLTAAGNQTIGATAGELSLLQPGVGNSAFIIGNAASARTAALSVVTFDGTVGAAAGGTLFDINVSQTGGAANPLFDIDVSGLYTGTIFDVLIGAVAYADPIVNIDTGATSTLAQALYLTGGAAARTVAILSIDDDGTSSGQAISINRDGNGYGNFIGMVGIYHNGSFTGVDTESAIDLEVQPSFTLTEPAAGTFTYTAANFDISNISVTAGAGTTLISALTLTGSADADAGRSRALVLGGTNAQNSIQFGTATTAPILYSSGAESIEFMDSTNVRGFSMDLTAAGDQSITVIGGGNFSLNQNSVGSGFIFTNAAGARTVPLIVCTFNGTDAGAGGGTLFDINVSQTGGGSDALFDIDVTALYASNIFDVLIGAVAYAGTIASLDLGATSTLGVALDVAGGAAARTTTLVNVDDAGTSTGQTFTVTRSGAGYGNGTGMAGFYRTSSFTGVDTETAIDLEVQPFVTLTEPGAGTFTYYGASIDMSGISVTAGVGTSVLACLNLVANADADVGTNLALRVASGVSAFGGDVVPLTTDGAALGTTALMWSDLFLASGAVINFNAGDGTLTSSATLLTLGGDGFSIESPPLGTPGLTLTNNNAARTVALVSVTQNGTVGAGAGGTFMDIDVSQTGAGANSLFDIDVSGLYTGDIIDIAIGAVAYAATIVTLNTGATSTIGAALDIFGGAAARSTSLMSITDSGTDDGQSLVITRNGAGYGNFIGMVGFYREANFTGVDTETAIDFEVSPSLILTEPAAGTFTYYGASIDMSGVAVTAGAGTTTIVGLYLLAGSDADAGTNLALFVDGGKVRFDGGGTSLQASAAGALLEMQASTITGNNASSTIAIGAAVSLGATTFANGTATLTMTDAVSLYIAGVPVASTNVAFTNTAMSLWVDTGYSRFDGRIIGNQGADVASATSLTLSDGNVFEVTGTTQIDQILTTSWQDGSIVTLIFNESVTVRHGIATSGANVTILLAAGGNFSATANDTLTLVLSSTTANGQAWREVARTAI